MSSAAGNAVGDRHWLTTGRGHVGAPANVLGAIGLGRLGALQPQLPVPIDSCRAGMSTRLYNHTADLVRHSYFGRVRRALVLGMPTEIQNF